MATKRAEKSNINSKVVKRPRRSVSPNNVVINGLIIDKIPSENLLLSRGNSFVERNLLLDNIMEESDPTLHDASELSESLSISLEDAVKVADENVQRFIQEVSNTCSTNGNIQDINTGRTKSEEGLKSFLSTIDIESKNKILNTLINVYKKEIISSVDNNNEEIKSTLKNDPNITEPDSKVKKVKKTCKDITNEYKEKPYYKAPAPPKPKSKNASPRNSNKERKKKPSTICVSSPNLKNPFDNNSLNIHRDNKTLDIERLLKDFPSPEISDTKKVEDATIHESENMKKDSEIHKFFAGDTDIFKNLPQYLPLNENVSTQERVTPKRLALGGEVMVNYHHTKYINHPNYKKNEINEKMYQPRSLYEEFDTTDNPFNKDVFKKNGKTVKYTRIHPSSFGENNQIGNNKAQSIDFKISPSKEEAINRILGKKPKENISISQYVPLNDPDNFILSGTSQCKSEKSSVSFYENIKKATEDPAYIDKRRFISEGVQVSYGPRRNSIKQKHVDVVKPYRYHDKFFKESKSDIAIECPFGCVLKFKKSKSDTDINDITIDKKQFLNRDINETKRRGKLNKNASKEKAMSVIRIDIKSSNQLLEARDARKHRQLINYLESDLKRGDSEFQVSQILFETAKKNIDVDASTLVIPTLEQKQVNSFNANYLLHAIKIQRKSEILHDPNFSCERVHKNASNPSITEEDYKVWLTKRNWLKYANIVQEIRSIEDLRSISQTMTDRRRMDCGEVGYYLDRGDTPIEPSKTKLVSNVFVDLSEIILYEHVVISRAINLFYSHNAKRIKIITLRDRVAQFMIFVLFCSVCVYLGNHVFVDPKYRIGSLWT